jgi:hypothetical protein
MIKRMAKRCLWYMVTHEVRVSDGEVIVHFPIALFFLRREAEEWRRSLGERDLKVIKLDQGVELP